MSAPSPALGGKYRLIRPLASGGMGKIWVGEHLELGTEVAIKRLDPARNTPDHWARFRREAMALAQLKSRHIVQIYDFAEDDEGPYIVMELLEGEDLSTALRRTGNMPPPEAFRVLEQVAKALAVAHSVGVVHRDIKPSNVFLAHEAGERERTVKVLDFGIAKHLGFGPETDTLTATGNLIGSPGYMSPEQIRGKNVDQRTDVWALTSLYHELLVGRPAFAANHVGDAMFNICQGTFTLASVFRPDLRALDPLFARGLAPLAEDRFPTVQALVEAACQCQPPAIDPTRTMDAFSEETTSSGAGHMPPPRRRSRLLVLLSALGVAAIVFGTYLWHRTDRTAPPDGTLTASPPFPNTTRGLAPTPSIEPGASPAPPPADGLPNNAPPAPRTAPVPARSSSRSRAQPKDPAPIGTKPPREETENAGDSASPPPPQKSEAPTPPPIDSFTGLPLQPSRY